MKTKPVIVYVVLLLCLFGSFPLAASVITVDTNSDGAADNSLCQLRDAIIAANTDTEVDGCKAGFGADRIEFNGAVSYIFLEADLPEIVDNLEIAGPGRDLLTIDGDDQYRMFLLSTLVGTFTLRDLTLFQGSSSDAGGCIRVGAIDVLLIEDVRIDSCSATNGAGLYVPGAGDQTITLRRMIFYNNVASSSGGGASFVQTNCKAVIEDTLFHANRSPVGAGLLLGSSCNLTISRSTFWGNSGSSYGSAIANVSLAAVLRIEHSTISQNSLTGVVGITDGGAITNGNKLSLLNTVVANNTELNPAHNYKDVYNRNSATTDSEGHNFIGSNEGAEADLPEGSEINGDQIGSDSSPLDPLLGDLMDNGGPTLTSLPDANSLLVDQGSCPGEISDQRGYGNQLAGLRPVDVGGVDNRDDGCDIGATERLGIIVQQLIHEDGFESPAP